MLIHGEYDDVADLDGLLPFFQQLPPKPRQRLLYVYASLSRLDLQGFFENAILVFLGITDFSPSKKPTSLMMHWWQGCHGGVCPPPYKRYVVIPKAGHMMHLQSGHRLFQHEVVSFFKAP
jgi:hypothetical protein